jgi:hypothetical protein
MPWNTDSEDIVAARDKAVRVSLLVSALQAAGLRLGHSVSAFMAKKAAKTYGLGNWLEGVVDPGLPIILIDDVVGSGKTMQTQGRRLLEFGLKIAGAWCIVACKTDKPVPMDIGGRVNADMPLRRERLRACATSVLLVATHRRGGGPADSW